LYSTVAVVIVILLITYRSPVLWILPVVSSGVALITAQAVVYLLAAHAGLTVNGLSAGILLVLVFGASTDYALLIVARYREELRRHDRRHPAMAEALRRAGPAIIASGSTVIVAMVTLSIAQLNSTKGLGPVLAIGVAVGMVAMLTLLPARRGLRRASAGQLVAARISIPPASATAPRVARLASPPHRRFRQAFAGPAVAPPAPDLSGVCPWGAG
jgi:uncharacterized membrane protein YdfJ with MMPL/SSD domain